MAILRTIVWFFYFFGALIVLTPKMNEAKRRKAAGDESGCRAIVDRYVPMWMSTLMRIAGCTVTVNGLENIPKDRAVVFTPNHQSDYDIPITLVHLDRPHALVAKVETLKIPLVRTWMKLFDCVFIDRKNPRQAVTAMKEAGALLARGVNPLVFDGLEVSVSSEESKAINENREPKVIISASGMCDAGRIRHHLKHNLWRKECAVVFVGYQAEGTLGRLLLDGAREVRMFGEDIAVRARIVNFKGLSSHADRNHLLEWAKNYCPVPQQTFVVHGQSKVTELFAQTLREHGIGAHAPDPGEVYDLLENRMLVAGTPRPEKPAAGAVTASPAYRRLEETARKLMEVVEHNRGGTNKDLAKFADQLKALMDKWDR